jgi:hypothetical protein
MTARLRRLQSDHDHVRATFASHPHIRLLSAEGTPPDKYTFAFHVQGLVPQGETDFVRGAYHL